MHAYMHAFTWIFADIKTNMQSLQKKINYKKIQPMEICLQSSTKRIRVSSLQVFDIPFKNECTV